MEKYATNGRSCYIIQIAAGIAQGRDSKEIQAADGNGGKQRTVFTPPERKILLSLRLVGQWFGGDGPNPHTPEIEVTVNPPLLERER